MVLRVFQLLLLVALSWIVMTVTHEAGHILGGACCGGTLRSADLAPWRLPYSFFEPDPFPLITLWAGLILGVAVPLSIALLVQRDWMWFIASFCLLANGVYIAAGWFSDDHYLDTPRLLDQGANSLIIALYCLLTIGFGYRGFRQACFALLQQPGDSKVAGAVEAKRGPTKQER